MPEKLAAQLSIEIDIGENGGLHETARSNRDLLAKAYDDLISGNPTALFDLLDPEVRFFEAESLPYSAALTGKDNAIAGVSAMLSHWQSMHCRITEYLAGGDMVIAYVEVRAEGPSGVFTGPVAELFRFRNGRVVEWRPIYWDTARVCEVLGEVG